MYRLWKTVNYNISLNFLEFWRVAWWCSGKREICKEKARVRLSVVDFFFTVETLPIIVKYFNNSWHRNKMASLVYERENCDGGTEWAVRFSEQIKTY